ncbi:CPBP family intramembrane glutamic endopeptidase [Maribacter sp. 2308TA10-17]|uniref:CPBP family intramembrane glutamic endopeptidase n=1 Tax=Maribacter sp. 2308TA10-17 TaxID=3386276 RepID=UPI0039BD140E
MLNSFPLLFELWNFIKNPVYIEDQNTDTSYRVKILMGLVGIGLAISIALGLVGGVVETIFSLDLGEHAVQAALEKNSPWYLFLLAVIIAPIFEELFFRGPMVFFREKTYFKYIFYTLTILFGFIHISNFEISNTVILLSPILVAPQIGVGVIFGFIRIRFGLFWTILCHALFNLILMGPVLILRLLDLPLE